MSKEVHAMTYEISQRRVPDQAIVSIRERIASADMPTFIGRAFGELYEHTHLLGVETVDEPFVIYHAFGPEGIDAEVCLSIAAEMIATGRITARVLPAATVAWTLHVGPYDELGTAYGALSAWVGQHGLEAVGPMRERYLNEPGPDLPPAEYRTVIEVPIAEVAVLVR
jgi:effector-binding domain-containing protein